ncbi:hypothetical protein [Exiguobacterium sp. s163]|uniref:hypothetical protein n=1 Tax=Exiguobacterium sp. s163 TaxID=2751287 RepID=UPI001BEBA519|nr:hypothetical protein [Exiguobacterium sp. s163]
MIFEATYKDMKKAMDMMRATLSDSEFKSGNHAVTLEATDNEDVIFYFIDKKNKVEITYKLKEAKMIYEGVATCSLKELLDALKQFSKSKEVILIERDGDELRVDDGVFPESVFFLFDDEDTVIVEEVKREVLFCSDGKTLSGMLNRASLPLKKTEFPSEKLDTQSIYFSSIEDGTAQVVSFSMHQSYYEKREVDASSPFNLILSKPKARALQKLSEGMGQLTFSMSLQDERPAIVLSDDSDTVTIVLKGDYVTDGVIANSMSAVFKGLNEKRPEWAKAMDNSLDKIGKLTVRDNLLFSQDGICLSPSGYPAKIIKDMFKNGFIQDTAVVGEVEPGAVLAIADYSSNAEKIFILSYRTTQGE